MLQFQFQSGLYRNTAELLDAVANAYLDVSPREIRESLATYTDDEMADDCIDAWNLDTVDEEKAKQFEYDHQAAHDYQHMYDIEAGREVPDAAPFVMTDEMRASCTQLGEWEADRSDLVQAFRRFRSEVLENDVEAA